ncbi:MAG: hypothetical protein IKZ22_02450, partial [Kiritimatiellae bacterium]|nr:hypothetical protein [Kiritimatiellia bacterium]
WFFVRGYFTTSNNWNRFFAYFTSKNSYHPIKQGLPWLLGVKNWGYSNTFMNHIITDDFRCAAGCRNITV